MRSLAATAPLVLATVFASGRTACAAMGQAKEILIPLVKFDDPESIRGWVADPWGGGTASLTMEHDDGGTNCLRMAWQKSASLSNPSVTRGLSGRWRKKHRVSEFYFRYRGDFAGSWLYFYYQTKHEGKHYNFIHQTMGSKDGQWRVQRVPLGGTPEPADHGWDFDIAELDTFCLSCRGRGVVRISEIGVVIRYTTLETTVSSDSRGVGSLAEAKLLAAEIDLGFVSPGNYLLYSAGTGGRDLLYRVELFDKDKLIAQKAGRSSRGMLCESLTNEQLGSAKGYIIRASVHDQDNGVVAFLEAELTDGATGIQVPLSCDSVALFPVPKTFTLAEGATLLSDATSVACASQGLEHCVARLSEELRAFYGIEIAEAVNASDAVIVMGLADDLTHVLKRYGLAGDVERLKHDGFLLWVGDDQIVAVAKEKRGVLYATDALIALTKMSSPETGPAQVRHLKVVDWPQFGLRPWMVSLNGWWPRRRYDVALYERMLATFPLAFRYNIFTFMLDDYYLWPSVPGHANPFAWSPDELSKVVGFVNRSLCPVIPHVSSLTHMGEFLDRVGPLRHLVERGDGFYDHRLCTRHPDTYPELFRLYDDMLRVCGRNKDYDSDYFHIQCDELSFKGPPCPRCAGIPRTKLIGDHLNRVAEYLQRKGKRPVMWADMFVESHPDSMSALRDRLPKQIVLTGWDPTRDDPEIPKLAHNGNEVWKVMTGYRGVGRLNDHRVKARGMLVANYHWWLSFARNLYTGAPYGPMAQALIANAAWNDFPDNDNSSWSEYCRVYGKWLMHNWSRKPLPGAGDGFVELDISAIANEPVTDEVAGDGKGWFDEGPDRDLSRMDFSAKKIDGVPMRFPKKGNTPRCAMFPPGRTDSCEIPVGRRLGSLILLHTAHLPPQKAIEMQKALEDDPEQGLELVVFTVRYADGSRASFGANYGWNVLNWRISPVSYKGKKLYHSRYATLPGAFSKYLPEARSLWEGHTGEAQKRKYPPDIAIHQYEWPNLSPEKRIGAIEIKSQGGPNISYALLAVTGRTLRIPTK